VVFGGFSPDAVRERMEFSDAKALVTIDGARRKGKTAPIKQALDERLADLSSIETVFAGHATRSSMTGTDVECSVGSCPVSWRPQGEPRFVTREISKGAGGLTVARHRGCADANAATQRTRRSPAATRVKSTARMISVDRTSGNEMSQSVAAACRLPRNPKNSALLFPRPMKTVCSIHFQ